MQSTKHSITAPLKYLKLVKYLQPVPFWKWTHENKLVWIESKALCSGNPSLCLLLCHRIHSWIVFINSSKSLHKWIFLKWSQLICLPLFSSILERKGKKTSNTFRLLWTIDLYLKKKPLTTKPKKPSLCNGLFFEYSD